MPTTGIFIALCAVNIVVIAALCYGLWLTQRLVLALTRLALGREIFTKASTPPPPSRFTQELYDEIMPRYHPIGTPDEPTDTPVIDRRLFQPTEPDDEEGWETVGTLGPLVRDTPDEGPQ